MGWAVTMRPLFTGYVSVIVFAVGGCANSTGNLAELEAKCVSLETSARFSCWWSSDTAPLTHCVMRDEDEPRCNLRQKAADYFNRGAYTAGDLNRPSQGIWTVLSVFEDIDGRVGLKATRTSGEAFLIHHSETPIDINATAPTEPKWPRWPAGIESGPPHSHQRNPD